MSLGSKSKSKPIGLSASWGVAPSIELWLLTTRAGVRISVLTNAMHKFVELYALPEPNYARRMVLPLVAPLRRGQGTKKSVYISMELLSLFV